MAYPIKSATILILLSFAGGIYVSMSAFNTPHPSKGVSVDATQGCRQAGVPVERSTVAGPARDCSPGSADAAGRAPGAVTVPKHSLDRLW